MSAAAKKGAIGIVAVLGLGFARFADDCGRVAARGARGADDLIADGARAGRLADDAVPGGRAAGLARWGPDGVVDGARAAAPSEPGALAEAIGELSLDVTAEVLPLLADPGSNGGAVPSDAVASSVACPRVHDLSRDAEAWAKFIGGFGIACAPTVFAVPAQGRELTIGGRTAGVVQWARACAAAGGACIVVGCPREDAACFATVADAFADLRLSPDLVAVTRAVVLAQVEEKRFSVIATTVGGAITVVDPAP